MSDIRDDSGRVIGYVYDDTLTGRVRIEFYGAQFARDLLGALEEDNRWSKLSNLADALREELGEW